ncbi:hypothetical protein [Lentiprolixibacter aurantiacus]|uniref:Uncharacterized protein n=1 Tax=Lentiprolixibacter aurantiacus TaxID=2993939 RepID=A0AAE3MK03_9FLAO|nr:hypothetical protein [Lentiprolixibacter aurantiacus]MCX2719185.1 hypothetical protein [Lentiprolixibacter aurantiacus]
MKLVKRILLILIALILVGGTAAFFYYKNKFMNAPPSTLTLSNLGQPFEFVWSGEKLNNKIEPHAAMLVPVTIPGVDRTLYMQFDTGAPSTVLSYKNVLSINEKYGDIFRMDTVDNRVRVVDASFKVGTVDVKASSVDIRGMGYTIDWADSTSVIKIGTVGSDFMEKHALIIDYKNEKITLMESVPETIEKEADFLPFSFDGRKVFLSAKLNDEPASLWFDSGSSAFELIVEEDTFLELAKPGAERESFLINSWGSKIPGHNIESNGMFNFGTTKVPLTYVTYFEWPNKLMVWTMKASNIGGDLGGMTGNKLFLGKTLVLDAPNLRYALVE